MARQDHDRHRHRRDRTENGRYYSEKDATIVKDTKTTVNTSIWKTKDQVTDWSKIKSYLIDLKELSEEHKDKIKGMILHVKDVLGIKSLVIMKFGHISNLTLTIPLYVDCQQIVVIFSTCAQSFISFFLIIILSSWLFIISPC